MASYSVPVISWHGISQDTKWTSWIWLIFGEILFTPLSTLCATPCLWVGWGSFIEHPSKNFLYQAFCPLSSSVFSTSKLSVLSRKLINDITTSQLCREGNQNEIIVFPCTYSIPLIIDFQGTVQWLRCCQVCIFIFFTVFEFLAIFVSEADLFWISVPILKFWQSLISPCLGLGANEAIAGYREFSLQRCQ